MLRTNGRFETHSRISPAGMFSSLIRPSSVRTRTHVNSDVRATSRYDDATPVTAAGAGVAGARGVRGGPARGPRGGGGGGASGRRPPPPPPRGPGPGRGGAPPPHPPSVGPAAR